MKIILKLFTFGTFLSLLLVCLHVMADQINPPLPAEITMNKDAGRGNWLIVTLRLESGEELAFVVDTGCPRTILDKSLESKLGKQLGATTILSLSGEKKAGIYVTPKFYLGNVQLIADSNILTCDLKSLSTHTGHSIMGLLGMDCLKNYCIQLDFESGKMRFLDSENLNVTGLGKSFPLKFSEGQENASAGIQPFIRHSGLLDETITNTIIDTGQNIDGAATGSAIKKHAAGSYSGNFFKRIKHFLTVENVSGRAVGLPQCVWDGNTYTNMIIGRAPGDAPSWIGLRFLARHLVTLNFPTQTMYLKQTSVGPI
jgi:Aspartyl protease